MATPRASGLNIDVWTKRVNGVATLALFGAVLGSSWVGGRVYRRWTKDVNLLTLPRARVQRIRTDYQGKKANAQEMGGLIGSMVVEVATAARQSLPTPDLRVVDSAVRSAMELLGPATDTHAPGRPSIDRPARRPRRRMGPPPATRPES
jgi:hypothetical protein